MRRTFSPERHQVSWRSLTPINNTLKFSRTSSSSVTLEIPLSLSLGLTFFPASHRSRIKLGCMASIKASYRASLGFSNREATSIPCPSRIMIWLTPSGIQPARLIQQSTLSRYRVETWLLNLAGHDILCAVHVHDNPGLRQLPWSKLLHRDPCERLRYAQTTSMSANSPLKPNRQSNLDCHHDGACWGFNNS